MQVFLYLDGGVEEFLTKSGQAFFVKAHKCSCLPIFFLALWLFPIFQVQSSSFVTVNVNDRKHTACYELRCIALFKGKSTFVDLVQTQLRGEVSEVVRSGHCQCRTNIHSATSSSELCCYASSTCVSSHTWTHKVDSHPSMQHPGVRGESSGDHDLAISLTNLASSSCSNARQKLTDWNQQVKFLSNATLFSKVTLKHFVDSLLP